MDSSMFQNQKQKVCLNDKYIYKFILLVFGVNGEYRKFNRLRLYSIVTTHYKCALMKLNFEK